MELNIVTLRTLCDPGHIQITLHGAKRLEQRNISLLDIISCIRSGEIIEYYPDDYPHLSCLILGSDIQGQCLHAVIGSDGMFLFLITAYYPDQAKWDSDYKTRKE